MKRSTVPLAALAAVLFALPAAAQSIYKYVRPDGRVVYSDKPVSGAKLEERLERAAPPDPKAAAAMKAEARKRARAASESAEERSQALKAISEEIRAASRSLDTARQRLEQGREPLPGERTGTVSGRSRLNEGYWVRQLENQEAVAAAQERLDHAYDARNALR